MDGFLRYIEDGWSFFLYLIGKCKSMELARTFDILTRLKEICPEKICPGMQSERTMGQVQRK